MPGYHTPSRIILKKKNHFSSESAIISALPYTFTQKGKTYLIIGRQFPTWSILNEDQFRFFEMFNIPIAYKEARKAYQGSLAEPHQDQLIVLLYNLGLVVINDEKVFSSYDAAPQENPLSVKPRTLLIRMTDRCNLNCKYCYVSAGQEGLSIPFEIVKTMVDQFSEISEDHFNIIFHGGEPLIEFDLIKDIISYCMEVGRSRKKRITFSIQSNGLLVDERVIAFLKEHNISIGISLDGWKSINDIHRVTPAGRSSYVNVVTVLQELKDNGNKYGILATITKDNVRLLPENVLHFQDMGFTSIKFSVFKSHGRGKAASLDPREEDLVIAYKQIIDLIVSKKINSIKVQNILDYMHNIVLFDRIYMCLRWPCGAGLDLLTLDVNGDVYPCDNFIGIPEFLLGNIKDDTLVSMMRSKARTALGNRNPDHSDDCRECMIWHFCGGGCPAGSYDRSGSVYHSDLCSLHKEIIEYLIFTLVEESNLVDYYRQFFGSYLNET